MSDFQYKGEVTLIGEGKLRVDAASYEPANPTIAAYVVAGAISRHIGQHPGKYTLLFSSGTHVKAFKQKVEAIVDDLNQNGAQLTVEFK